MARHMSLAYDEVTHGHVLPDVHAWGLKDAGAFCHLQRHAWQA